MQVGDRPMQVKLINLGQLSTNPIISINVPLPYARPMSYYYTASITMLSSKGHLSHGFILYRSLYIYIFSTFAFSFITISFILYR